MVDFQTIIARPFADYGTDITLTRGGVDRTVRALFVPTDNNTINTYYDGNEAVGLVRPAGSLFVAGTQSDPPLLGDVFTVDGRFWTVEKVQAFRVSSAIVLILALCD